MRLIDHNSFAGRMIAIVLTATGVALLTMTTAFVALDVVSARAAARAHLVLLADILAQNSSASIDFNDATSAKQVLEALKSEQQVEQGCLYDSSGRLFAQYRRSESVLACAESTNRISSAARGHSVVTRSVESNGVVIGNIFLDSVPREVFKRWKGLLSLAGMLLLLSFVLGSTAGLLLQRKISTPISELAHAMHRVTIGQDFSTRVAEVGPTEIRQLCAGFNTMLAEIDRSHAQSLHARQLAEKAQARLAEKHSALEKERGMLRGLIDNIPDLVFVKDIRRRWIVGNSRLARLVGVRTPLELVGKTDSDYLPEGITKAMYMDDEHVMASGEPLHNRDEVLLDENGNELHLLTTKVPLRDKGGKIIGIAGIGRDITFRKKMETALRNAEQKYRGIFDNAIVGIFQSSLDGRFLSVNPAMALAFGYDSPEQMCASVSDIGLQLYEHPRLREEFLASIEMHGEIQNFEGQAVRKDGTRLWVSLSARAIRKNGKIECLEGMCENITERHLLRQQLLQAQKLESVGQLAAGIAHEINTPTQYIGDNVRFLKDGFHDLVELLDKYGSVLSKACSGNEDCNLKQELAAAMERADTAYLLDEIPKAIEQTLEGVKQVSTLVTALKEFSHPGIKEKVQLDLNHALQTTIAVARNEWKYVADMVTDFDPSLPLVPCRPGEFNQVILNLIVNAAHAVGDVVGWGGSKKGKITVRTRKCPKWAEIRVEDTGTGIAESIRERIFDPFFTTKEIGKGTGQGLAIAHSMVVVKHGGTIQVETEVGRGTTFIIRLPLDGKPLAP